MDRLRSANPRFHRTATLASLRASAGELDSFAVRIAVLLIAALLGAPFPAVAQVIVIEDSSASVNGKPVSLPGPEGVVLDAIGGGYETDPPRGDAFSNWVFRWKQLGVEAYSNPVSRHVDGLRLLLAPPGYWKGALFSGELWIDGHLICPDDPAEVLEALGFADDYGNLSLRRGCFYVTIDRSYDAEAQAIEIGNSVEEPLYNHPLWRNRPDPCESAR